MPTPSDERAKVFIMLILGWIVWVIAASTAFGFICHMRADAKKEQPIHILMIFQVLLMLSSVAAMLIRLTPKPTRSCD